MDTKNELSLFETQASDLAMRASFLEITDQETLTACVGYLLIGKEIEKKIRDFFAPLKTRAHSSWKELCNAESKELSKIMPVMQELNKKIAAHKVEQERKRKEAELEWTRAEQEIKRIEEEAMRRAREVQLRGLAEKNEATRRATQDEAKKILAQAAEKQREIVVPSPPEAPKTEGLGMRDNWDFEIIDETAIPREFLMPDETKIRKVVRDMKEKTGIPGILAVNRPIMVKSSKA